MGALRFARSDVFVMGELRVLVARCGYPPREMSDGEVLERIGHLLAAGYLQALECGGKPSAAAPPSISFGELQVHVGSPKEDFTACSSHHSHEPLRGAQTAERLGRIVRSGPAGAAALVEAAVQATGNTGLRNLSLAALVGSLAALIASGKLILAVCRPAGGGGGGAGQAASPAGASTPPSKGASPSGSPAPSTVLTYVCVELVDEDGNALDGEDYEITLSDGSTHKAKTTKSPFYADQIPEGVCSLKFPNLHKNHWRPPGSK